MNPHDYIDTDPSEAFMDARLAIADLDIAIPGIKCFADFTEQYMYMYTCRVQGHAFKHIDTRKYLYVPVAP